MKVSGVVLDLSEKTNNVDIYGIFHTCRPTGYSQVKQTRFLNIQQVLKDKVPGKFSKLANFYVDRQLDDITRINIR